MLAAHRFLEFYFLELSKISLPTPYIEDTRTVAEEPFRRQNVMHMSLRPIPYQLKVTRWPLDFPKLHVGIFKTETEVHHEKTASANFTPRMLNRPLRV